MRASSFSVAGTGPRPISRGATPALALPTTRARGVSPCRRTAASLATTIAAAPSDSGDDDAAVTMPPARKTGLREASFSSVVDRRGPSSAVTSPSLVGTGTSSASNRPASAAATARW